MNRTLTRRLTASVAIVANVSLVGCALESRKKDPRLEAIERARVWNKTNVSAMDIRRGPTGPGSFASEAMVTCDYIEKKMTGRSPKFTCVIPPDDEMKVKYGADNGEVYAEVAATRLLWALGFGADRMYPVRIVCRGCPDHIVGTDVAVVERKIDGVEIESDIETGWAWQELDLVDPAKGGATRAERDALTLLAVFLQHTDSKAPQQRLLCLDEKGDKEATCQKTFMHLQDVGLTFGHATRTNGTGSESASLEAWAGTPIWKGPQGCVANLRKSLTGTLTDPVISEEGRKFLSSLLMQLSDRQLRDLFDVARFDKRPVSSDHPEVISTIDQWVDAFKKKRSEIAGRRCSD